MDETIVKMDGWSAILDTTAETLDRARQVARVMQDRTRPLMPLPDHALAPLSCEEWSQGWADCPHNRHRISHQISIVAIPLISALIAPLNLQRL